IASAGSDLDGESWLVPPSMGCDEYYAGAVTGPLTVTIQTSNTTLLAGIEGGFVAQVAGQKTASDWNFGDGTIVSNLPFVAHSWNTPGDYPVVLSVYNDDFSSGITATLIVHVIPRLVHYVNAASISPSPPYGSWDTAARSISDAIE